MPPALHVACGQGSLEAVKTIVRWMEVDAQDGRWMSLKDEHGQTCVHCAAHNGHFAVLEFLCVHRSADINARDKILRTPLLLAVESGSLKTVQWMVNHGAQPNSAIDHRGDNALLMSFFACTRRPKKGRLLTSRFAGDDGNVEGLHDQRGDDSESNFNGIEEQRRNRSNIESMNIVRYLLALASVEEQSMRNYLGETMLTLACKYGMESLVKVALESPAAKHGNLLNSTTERGENALHQACRAQSVRIIWLLRTYRCSAASTATTESTNANKCSNESSHESSIQPTKSSIMRQSIDEDRVSKEGLTPLDIATSTGNPDVMDAMLSPHPLKPSSVGTLKARRWEEGGKKEGLTRAMLLTSAKSHNQLQRALMAASKYGRTNLIARLITVFKCQVSNNVVDGNGNTPLHVAVLNRKWKSAELLKRKGFSVETLNRENKSPLMLAAELKDGGRMLNMLKASFFTLNSDI